MQLPAQAIDVRAAAAEPARASADSIPRVRTRDQKKAQTRRRLLEAAAQAFPRNGYAATSLDEVAKEAGLTKGAVYSNFSSKEDLVQCMLAERMGTRFDVIDLLDGGVDGGVVGGVERGTGNGHPHRATLEERASDLGRALFDAVREDRSWFLLSVEFAAHMARQPPTTPRSKAPPRRVRTAVLSFLEDVARETDAPLPLPPDQLAAGVSGLVTGLAVEQMSDPEAVRSEVAGAMMAMLVRGATRDGEPAGAGALDH